MHTFLHFYLYVYTSYHFVFLECLLHTSHHAILNTRNTTMQKTCKISPFTKLEAYLLRYILPYHLPGLVPICISTKQLRRMSICSQSKGTLLMFANVIYKKLNFTALLKRVFFYQKQQTSSYFSQKSASSLTALFFPHLIIPGLTIKFVNLLQHCC